MAFHNWDGRDARLSHAQRLKRRSCFSLLSEAVEPRKEYHYQLGEKNPSFCDKKGIRFEPKFPLTEGLNSLTLVFATSDGGQRTETRSVFYDPVVANNVVIAGDFAYAAQGVNGLAVVNLMTRTRTLVDARVDDLSFDGTFLCTLNTGSGSQALSVYSLVDPANPVLISGPLSANTGFFSGVSAANGRVVTERASKNSCLSAFLQ